MYSKIRMYKYTIIR